MSTYIEMALESAGGDMEALMFSKRRSICARRARKLRKRGEDVRFIGFTRRNKSIYLWVQAPNDQHEGRYPAGRRSVHLDAPVGREED